MIRKIVLLPEPDGPSKATSWPDGTSNETPSTAWNRPNRFARFFTTMPTSAPPDSSLSTPRRSCPPPASARGLAAAGACPTSNRPRRVGRPLAMSTAPPGPSKGLTNIRTFTLKISWDSFRRLVGLDALAEHLHADQHDERDAGQQQAGGVGPLDVEALDAVVDVEGGRLGPAEDVPRDDQQRAELAERAGDGQRDAVGQAPADRGERDASEGPPTTRAQGIGDLLLIDAELAQDRHDLADDERQRDEGRRQEHAGPGVDDADPGRAQPGPEPPMRAIEDDEHQPGDDRRDGERQVDQAIGQRFAPEPMPDQDHREGQAEDGVDGRRAQGDRHRQPERPLRVGRGDRRGERANPSGQRRADQGEGRDQDQHREPGQDRPRQHPAQDGAPPPRHRAMRRGHSREVGGRVRGFDDLRGHGRVILVGCVKRTVLLCRQQLSTFHAPYGRECSSGLGRWSRFRAIRIPSEQASRTTETTIAPWRLPLSISPKMYIGPVLVSSGRLPATITTLPNSPRARLNAKAVPVTIAGQSVGNVTRRKIVRGRAPRVAAASSSAWSISSKTGCTRRITNG